MQNPKVIYKIRYPWEEWLRSGRKVRLTRGKDFWCMPHSMAVQIRNAAYKHKKKVRVRIEVGDKETVFFQVA